MEVKIITGLKKNSQVYYVPEENQIYQLKNDNPSKTYIRCYYDECSVNGSIDKKSGLFSVSPDLKHQYHSNHSYETQFLIAKFEFYDELRKKSKSIGSSLKNIFEDLYVKFRPKLGNIIITYPSVISSMKNWRQEANNLPTRPSTVEDILEQIKNLKTDEYFALDGQPFVHIIESKTEQPASIALYTQNTIEKILNTHQIISAYCDSTFRFFPSFFYQLMIFHFNIGKHAFATIFIFMQKKNFNSYVDIFEHLKNIGINFNEIVLDYEMATRKAALKVFPNIKLSGCHFHHGQALWRNMKRLCKSTNSNLVRKLQCVAMLPPNLINETYFSLKADYPDRDYKKFFKYYEKEWLHKVKPINLSIFDSIQRTNNICESFNSYLKNYVSENMNITSSSNFWNVVKLLLQFYVKNNIQLRDYIDSNFQKNIRIRSKVKSKLQKEAVIKSLYSKLANGMSGVEFVEALYPKDYERMFDQLVVDSANQTLNDYDDISSDDDTNDKNEDELSLIRKCEACFQVRRIVGGFKSCFHIILCRECVTKVNEMCRLPNGNVTCIRCRKETDEAKIAFY